MSKGLIHHVELYVSDLKRSVDFWGWFLEDLGYYVYQKWDAGRSYKLGESYIVFVQTDEAYLDVPYHRKRVGLNHLAFHGESRAHVDSVTRKLKEKKVPILYADVHPYAGGSDYYAVYFGR